MSGNYEVRQLDGIINKGSLRINAHEKPILQKAPI